MTDYSLRRMMGRLRRAKSNVIYWSGSEIISVRETVERHRAQDGSTGNAISVKNWIRDHCVDDFARITNAPPEASWDEIAHTWRNWIPVTSEESCFISGFQDYSQQTVKDFPMNHETLDWNWVISPDPQYTYMLTKEMMRHILPGPIYIWNNNQPSEIVIAATPFESEWESGSMPMQWQPFEGEYVTMWGRHVFDRGHGSKTEIHPAHTIVRQHTTAATLGNNNVLVPVNRAIIGMGLSGGFPGYSLPRWELEFGRRPNAIWGDTEDCWPTNLKKHPLKLKLYPPVPKPSPTARLNWRVVLCEYIEADNFRIVDDFLELCQYEDPASGGEGMAFRQWNRSKHLPTEFTPQVVPVRFRPKFTLQRDAYFDIEIDLSSLQGIILGYYAILECGWSEPGSQRLFGFDVTFQSLRVLETEETWDDWHLYYGVNGRWAGWWTDDFVEEDESHSFNTSFRIYTIDEMPIMIRDCGIEWDGLDNWNERLDEVSITAPGPNHFDRILEHPGVTQVQRDENTLRFHAQGQGGATVHRWTIRIKRFL